MRSVPLSMPQAESIAWERSVGVFNDYYEAKRAIDRLSEGGLSLDSVTIVVDGSAVPVDRRVATKRSLTTLLGLVVGAVVGAGLAGVAAAAQFAGLDIDWPEAALYGLLIGGLVGPPVGNVAQAFFGRDRTLPGASANKSGTFRVVVAPEDFDRASHLLRPRPRRAIRAPRTAPPFRV